MKFSKLILALMALAIFSGAVKSYAQTYARDLFPVYDERGNPVLDARGNCVRSIWAVNQQIGDPCGPPPPTPVLENMNVEKQRNVQYVDLIRQSIYFLIDKDNIDAVDEQRMNDVINEISKSSAIRDVKMVGYADRFGDNKYNIDLSKRRAANVLDYFRGRGLFNNMRVGFGFFGEERPVTNCPTNISVPEQIACLQADRRVDIEVEVLRERTETYTETVQRISFQAPAYPRPGTSSVEVYSNMVGDTNMTDQTETMPSITPLESERPFDTQMIDQIPGQGKVPVNSPDMPKPQQ